MPTTKKVVLITFILMAFAAAALSIDLTIYGWSNIDTPQRRLFVNRWEENVMCFILILGSYITFLYYRSFK